MDVKGPTDSPDVGSNLPTRRRELLRHRLADASHSSAHVPRHAERITAEVYELTQQLRGIPEVRDELVLVAALKLREEHFSTRESAERTAEAILRTLSKD